MHFWRNIRYSQSWWKSLFKFHVRFTRRIWITLYGLHVLKRSLYFHFTANISKLFNVVIYREYNLVWKHGWSIRNDEKGLQSPIFVLDENHCTSSMFDSLMTNAPKCTSHWCLSTEQFFRAAEKIFTQNTIEYGLSENCGFDFKFNVPVGFWWYWN